MSDQKYQKMSIVLESGDTRTTTTYEVVSDLQTDVKDQSVFYFDLDDPHRVRSNSAGLLINLDFRVLPDETSRLYTELREKKVDGEWVPDVCLLLN